MTGESGALVGVVLCGGASRRMGRDKALIGDPPWAARVAAALRGAGCAPVVLSGSVPGLDRLGEQVVPDESPGGGPLWGAASAVGELADSAAGPPAGWRGAVVAACDLPEVHPGVVLPLVEAVEAGAPAAAWELGGRPQWSLVCLGPVVAASLRPAVGSGERSWHAVLSGPCRLLPGAGAAALADVDEILSEPHGLYPSAEHGPGGAQVTIPEITVDELASLLEQGAVLVDVREPDEWIEVRVPAAIHIPLGALAARMDEIPEAGTVHVICRSGARSMKAAEQLVAAGRPAVNVAGGTLAWVDSGRPTASGD